MNTYEKRIQALHKHLGIPDDYQQRFELPQYKEALELVEIGKNISGSPCQLTPQAYNHWQAMEKAAELDSITLQVVSAFRSVERQAEIIKYKLSNGQLIEDILKVSAAPGYSEHHTGNALDITTPGYQPLEEVFENSDAFHWLQKNADRFMFFLSYPRNNKYNIAYEPWHWKYCSETKQGE